MSFEWKLNYCPLDYSDDALMNAQITASPWQWLSHRHVTDDYEFHLPPKRKLPGPMVFSQPETPFSFMDLPDEIKLHIMFHVKVASPVTFLKLCEVHPWFKATICEVQQAEALLAIEMKTPGLNQLFTKTLTCFTCLHILPLDAFAEISRIIPMDMGGSQAHKRCCVGCQMKTY
ncbi:MAG: hypothetical protein Q9192_001096 [Flavoplaca navasiana]